MIQFKTIKSDTGTLTQALIPFLIRRVFFIYNSESVRGEHAHKETNQVLCCIQGSVTVDMDGKYSVVLKSPDCGLYVPAKVWHSMKFTKGSILLVFADKEEDETDRIRDYGEYLDTI